MSDLIGFSIFEKQEENLREDLKPGLIYKLTAPNGKVYIGLTTLTFEERLQRHKSDIKYGKGCPILGKAVNKHGWDNFHKEVLLTCNNCDLDEYERKFIAIYDSANLEKGYNLTLGGRSNQGCSDEQRKILSDKRRVQKTYDLPVGIRHVIDKRRGDEGFRVRIKIQKTEEFSFVGKDFTMEEKLAMALECREILLRGEKYVKKPMKRNIDQNDLPPEITVSQTKRGITRYDVKNIDGSIRIFDKIYKTDVERKAAALAYHASIYNNNNN
ncbi:GIY-YIG catalytic domain-containing endonuclease [Faustovirus]|nr:GIY-YIG catalytic domain-containing endonuclease [Faustovirus]QJX72463.1 GIY-YIG catalytic domain-containing endonuclease [Faustovirus]